MAVVLKVSRRGAMEDVRDLSVQEDQAPHWAFGRFAEPDARAASVAVIRRYQRAGGGCRILCDCCSAGKTPPALVPVSKAHFRRRYEHPWPACDLECDFHRDAAEQRAITRSHVRWLSPHL